MYWIWRILALAVSGAVGLSLIFAWVQFAGPQMLGWEIAAGLLIGIGGCALCYLLIGPKARRPEAARPVAAGSPGKRKDAPPLKRPAGTDLEAALAAMGRAEKLALAHRLLDELAREAPEPGADHDRPAPLSLK